jgi:signal transduction histidine kinase
VRFCTRRPAVLFRTSAQPERAYDVCCEDVSCLLSGSREPITSMLHDFIAIHRKAIILRCQAKVAARLPVANEPEIYGVPLFLEQLTDALRLGLGSSPAIAKSAIQHGRELFDKGFTVSQVVHDYGDVCQSITELAIETNAAFSAADFRNLNRCLDDAIAGAVTEYGRKPDPPVVDVVAATGADRLGFFAHELRNLVSVAMVSFDVLKTGNVGIAGSTGSVLHRSLLGMRALIGQSLAEVRLTHGLEHREPVRLSDLIDEVVAAAALHAHTVGIQLSVLPVDPDVVIEGDRQVLAAVIANVVQNAFKFTRPHTAVTVRVRASTERVLIEIEDECGGLPDGNPEDLFRPFERRGPNRSGLGLGLAFSRLGAESNHGRLYARSLPGRGCVFTVDLPRVFVPSEVATA